MKRIPILLLTILSLGMGACDYLDVKPSGQVIPETVTEYRALLVDGYYAYPLYKQLLALRSDEVFPYATKESAYDMYISVATWDEYNPGNYTPVYPWQRMYKTIFYANSIIENIDGAIKDTQSDSREQLKAEALLLRAYTHFELLNLYGKPYAPATAATDRGIPMSLKIDIEQNYVPQTVEQVYQQVLEDIEEGERLMQVEDQPESTRYRFSKRSAKALEARVRLYRSEWALALAAAEELLPCELENLNDPNAKAPYDYSSREAIMALDKLSDADFLGSRTYMLPNIMDKYRKDGSDLRVGLYFKKSEENYEPAKGYSNNIRVTFRGGEIYLIAAEAAAHIDGKLSVAKNYLKQLMEKRLTPAYYAEKAAEVEAMNQAQLIDEIADERARELALEGHRWYDLRRTTRPVMVKVYTDKQDQQQTATLSENDTRYTIRFPKEAVAANPDLN